MTFASFDAEMIAESLDRQIQELQTFIAAAQDRVYLPPPGEIQKLKADLERAELLVELASAAAEKSFGGRGRIFLSSEDFRIAGQHLNSIQDKEISKQMIK